MAPAHSQTNTCCVPSPEPEGGLGEEPATAVLWCIQVPGFSQDWSVLLIEFGLKCCFISVSGTDFFALGRPFSLFIFMAWTPTTEPRTRQVLSIPGKGREREEGRKTRQIALHIGKICKEWVASKDVYVKQTNRKDKMQRSPLHLSSYALMKWRSGYSL